MAKKQINYSDLSPKELELLKDIYIDQKVKSMNFNDLKNFAVENISLQIKSTIGNDEELEAWHEMEEFFKDELENTIQEIKIKFRSKKGDNYHLNVEKIEVETEEKREDKKLDMWED
tara:strand:- start:1630 stop:1980 length:351 start_codon:yes stop_codon:yes gene_type:complete